MFLRNVGIQPPHYAVQQSICFVWMWNLVSNFGRKFNL